MKEISSIPYVEQVKNLINPFLPSLNTDSSRNHDKILELCHVGKFLTYLEDDFRIEKVSERPDFLIKSNNQLIGLEHHRILDQKSREREGYFENLIRLTEKQIQKDNDTPNFLANCYIKDSAEIRLDKKSELVSILKSVVKEYVLNNCFIENPIIESISKMPHSKINLVSNLGAWVQKTLTKDILENAIKKKEAKIEQYRENSVKTQWLLIVIGSLKESSYELTENFEFEYNSKFDRLFLMEDFNGTLFEI